MQNEVRGRHCSEVKGKHANIQINKTSHVTVTGSASQKRVNARPRKTKGVDKKCGG